MTMPLDVARLADILREAAKAEILPRFRRLGIGDIRAKKDSTDLVTEADVNAERMIKREVAAIAPDALFIGEESVAEDASLLGKLEHAELAVIIDPVDGTFNFASGIPAFGVMASVVWKGETVAGLIYDPIGDDWAMAEKGSGAFLRRADGSSSRLSVAAAQPLDEMVGIAAPHYFYGADRARILSNMAKVRLFLSYRCSAHEYRTFCGGHTQFILYNELMPWDHLAGVLIAQEAGGHVARLDGSVYLPHHFDGGLLLAPDRDSWDVLRRELVG